MKKFYTENKQMYFEVQECEDHKDKFEIHAFYKHDNRYDYERQIPEGIFFDSLYDAGVVAESLSWVFDWGVENTKENYNDIVIEKIKNTLDSL